MRLCTAVLGALTLSACTAPDADRAPADQTAAGDPSAAGDPTWGDPTGGEPYTGPSYPNNGWIVWGSSRAGGGHEIYRMQADGSDVQQLTFGGGRGPIWSPGAQWIAYYRDDTGTVHVMRSDGSEDTPVCENVPPRDGPPYFWMHDGSGLICPTTLSPIPIADLEFHRVDPDSGDSELLFNQHDFAHLINLRFDPGSISNDGRYMVGWAHNLYTGGYTGDNGTFDNFHATVVLDLNDKSKVFMLGPGCLSASSPVSDTVYHVSRESATAPDVFRLRLSDLASRSSYAIELGFDDLDWGHEYMPSVSNDGEWLVYAASLACHPWYQCDYELFIHRLAVGARQRHRLTFDEANDNFPSLFIGDL